ncbi:antibiotic biosynthesis monooxygenase [Streptomyces sp. ISL-12]|uniref:putative quinol monooxygenase n=1 Tax=Streptomyces sp. ISL-12 TaxID=2819177 RepID=UPI001BEBA051|nr:antibiotic biosynthesis monooxygenase [Streptomyces sp. ISL-12]MBT2410433.1 antibiotic biosynthesis monooxygenase [Streptomyces sp. ISL-12]
MSEGFGLVVRFTLRDQQAETAFDGLCAETLAGIKSREPETLTYVMHIPVDEPLVRVFYELYADRSAFEAHEEQSHTNRFLVEREQFLTGTEVTSLDAIAGKRAV